MLVRGFRNPAYKTAAWPAAGWQKSHVAEFHFGKSRLFAWLMQLMRGGQLQDERKQEAHGHGRGQIRSTVLRLKRSRNRQSWKEGQNATELQWFRFAPWWRCLPPLLRLQLRSCQWLW